MAIVFRDGLFRALEMQTARLVYGAGPRPFYRPDTLEPESRISHRRGPQVGTFRKLPGLLGFRVYV